MADTRGMSMHEVICPSCGAINHAEVDTCWRCLAQVFSAEPSLQASASDAASA
jgi:acetone carboxylase gamma subunit